MQKINQQNSGLETQVQEEKKVIKFGLDIHLNQITVCRQIDGLLPQPAQKMDWQKCLDWIKDAIDEDTEVYSCYEAGPFGYGLHRKLEALGVTNYVVVPQRWDEKGSRVKTDRRDARELVDRLDRYVRGNKAAFSVVRVPTPFDEERRSLGRQREWVVRERKRCLARARSILWNNGIRLQGEWWNQQTWKQAACQMPQWVYKQVNLWQKKVIELEEQIAELTIETQKYWDPSVPIIKGLGKLTSSILDMEVGDWNRFKNRKQVGSFLGLCPSENSSGNRRRQGSINKCGHKRLRWLIVEAMWRLMHWQPYYQPIAKLRNLKGSLRKQQVIAAARRFAIDLWRIRTGQCTAEKLGLILVYSN